MPKDYASYGDWYSGGNGKNLLFDQFNSTEYLGRNKLFEVDKNMGDHPANTIFNDCISTANSLKNALVRKILSYNCSYKKNNKFQSNEKEFF